jgi:integrase-like protein
MEDGQTAPRIADRGPATVQAFGRCPGWPKRPRASARASLMGGTVAGFMALLTAQRRDPGRPHGGRMTRLSPQTLTTQEQAALLREAEGSPREALLFSLALGTGLRLAEIVGLDVGDVYLHDGVARVRVRLRAEQAPAQARAVRGVQASSWGTSRCRRAPILLPDGPEALEAAGPGPVPGPAGPSGLRPPLPSPRPTPHGDHERLQGFEGPVPGAEVRETCEPADHGMLYPSQ